MWMSRLVPLERDFTCVGKGLGRRCAWAHGDLWSLRFMAVRFHVHVRSGCDDHVGYSEVVKLAD